MTISDLQLLVKHNLSPYDFFVLHKKWVKATNRLTPKSFCNFVNLFANKGYSCNLVTDKYRHKEAWSNSRLGIVALSIRDLEYKGPERAFTFGSAVHEMFLENEIFDIEEFNLRKSEMAIINLIREKLWQNDYFLNLVNNGECEKPILWTDADTGLLCKGKVDILHNNILYDLKTTASKTEDEFLDSFKKYDYDRQGAFYMDGCNVDHMIFIAISKFEPYDIFPVLMSRGDKNYIKGKMKYQFLLRKTIELNLLP